jgi:hypothetical protein
MSDSSVDLTASELNNIGVDLFRTRDLTTAFQFFYHSIERLKNGRASAMPPAASTSATAEPSRGDISTTHGLATGEPMQQPSHGNFSDSWSTSTPRSRLEGIFANALLFQDQAYCCPFRISHSSESQHFYFSPDPTHDYILCSCIAVFNMAITVNAMDDVTAATNRIHDRHQKIKGLFSHCLQLLSFVLDSVPSLGQEQLVLPAAPISNTSPPLCHFKGRPERREILILPTDAQSSRSFSSVMVPSALSSVTLATCDLLGMACLNNLIFMTIESDLPTQCCETRMLHLQILLSTVSSIQSERYGNDQDITAVMSQLADMFLVTVFFLLRFPPGPVAAAA